MEQYNRYKRLKEKLAINYKGIELNRVMAKEIWLVVNSKPRFNWRNFFISRCCFLTINLKKLDTTKPLMTTFRLTPRRDYLELYNIIIDKLDKDKTNINNLNNYGFLLTFHPWMIIKIFYQVLRRTNELPFYIRLRLAYRFCFYSNVILSLKKINLDNIKKYLAFCSVLDEENLFTQFFNNKNIQTYSLQHGLFYKFEENIPIDILNYDNFESNFFLSWGQYSVDIKKSCAIDPNRLLVAGYPKSEKINVKNHNPFQKGLVLLSRSEYHSCNLDVLQILQTFKKSHPECSFYLKTHPSLDYEIYRNYAGKNSFQLIDEKETLISCLDPDIFDYAISINTGSYYETLLKGIPCLRYENEAFVCMEGFEDKFRDLEAFKSIYNIFLNMNLTDYQHKIDSVLAYVLGVGIDKYKEILTDNI